MAHRAALFAAGLDHNGLPEVGRGDPSSCSSNMQQTPPRIDAHVHIWGLDGYPEAQPSPPELVGTVEALRSVLAASGLQGALIVQPINYKFDHTPVGAALEESLWRRWQKDYYALADSVPQLRGMALADPSMEPAAAVAALEALVGQGFTGVRFNPDLAGPWRGSSWMVGPTGRALYSRCGELRMPVGVMCFTGLLQSADDIETLLALSPATLAMGDYDIK